MSVVALVIAPSIAEVSPNKVADVMEVTVDMHKMHNTDKAKDVQVKMTKQEDGTFKAIVTTSVTKDGKTTQTEQVFTGTEEEVKAQVHKLNGMTTSFKRCANCKGKEKMCPLCKKKAAKKA